MTPHPSLESYEPGPRFGRFDQAVILTMVSAILLTALLIWRGDRVGVVVEQLTPTAGAEQVSTQAVMRITFAQDMLANRAAQITLDPPVEGTARWEGRTLVFEPATALQPETTYTVEVEAGLSSQQGRLLLEPVRWTFHTSRPRVVYLRYAFPAHQRLIAFGAQCRDEAESGCGIGEYGSNSGTTFDLAVNALQAIGRA